MEEKLMNTEEVLDTEEAVEDIEEEQQEELELIDEEILKFNALVEKDPQEAYRRYGFSLLCSLDDEDMAREILRIRKKPQDACDIYNRGVFELQNGKIDKALKDFDKAKSILLGMHEQEAKYYILDRPALPTELAYNIFLAMSEQGEKSDGKKECKKILKFAKGLFPNEEDLPALFEAIEEIEEEL